ncbi:uncharacterized protein LOC125032988 [Penaeus chinensis]|uniref:uncharacterized protein LOC125032988 n=1 Tax=Penaeus chinensis TaxID=139456 RepID=UPI001FB57007|nr:uncharacterized protein LOC125032988 [Penaeus chinensis]
MADAKPIDSAGAFGIPKWMMRKGTRYEVDDFIVSPPSNEDGGFFHLRYGRAPSPRPSTYDRINQELGMTVEVKDGDPVLSSGGKSDSLTSPTTTLSISPQGLSVQGSQEGSPSSPGDREHSIKPLLILPFKFGADCTAATSDSTSANSDSISETLEPTSSSKGFQPADTNLINEIQESLTKITVEDSSRLSDQNGQNAQVGSEKPEKEHAITRKVSREANLKLSLTEKIQDFSGASQPASSVVSTPFVTPLTTPQSSPRSKRKISGVIVDQSNMSSTQNYFFTRPFSGSQDTGSALSPEANTVSLSASALQGAQKLEDGAAQALSIDTSQMITGKKKQRPKASKLREMNFWAPTSM